MVTRYVFCIIVFVIIWMLNIKFIIQGFKKRIFSEFYMHIGLSIFFTLLTAELTIGNGNLWERLGILWLQIIAWILYIPSFYLVVASHIALTHKGKPGHYLDTTILINSGIYSVIRQPMTLGMAIWSVALILLFQSVVAVILGLCSIFCFWKSAVEETGDNIKKLGPEYKEYSKKVPMWNVFKGA